MTAIWTRRAAHGVVGDAEKDQDERSMFTKTEHWNLICRGPRGDMSVELASTLWPDMSLGFIRTDRYAVQNLSIRSISTSEHILAKVELKKVGRGDKRDPNPLARPLTFEMHTEYIEVPGGKDADGNLITNTAFDPIAGLIDYEPILVFEGIRYVTKTPDWLVDFAEKCTNSTEVSLDGFVCAPYTLKMEGLGLSSAEITEVNGREILYRELPIKFAYRKKTWFDEFLNAGLTEYFPAVTNPFFPSSVITPERRERCVDAKGTPVEKPVQLTKDGQRFRHKVARPTAANPDAYEWAVKEVLKKEELHTFKKLRLKKLDFNLLLK